MLYSRSFSIPRNFTTLGWLAGQYVPHQPFRGVPKVYRVVTRKQAAQKPPSFSSRPWGRYCLRYWRSLTPRSVSKLSTEHKSRRRRTMREDGYYRADRPGVVQNSPLSESLQAGSVARGPSSRPSSPPSPRPRLVCSSSCSSWASARTSATCVGFRALFPHLVLHPCRQRQRSPLLADPGSSRANSQQLARRLSSRESRWRAFREVMACFVRWDVFEHRMASVTSSASSNGSSNFCSTTGSGSTK